MRILVACDLPAEAVRQLRSLASDVIYQPALSAAELREQIAGVGILVVGGTRVSGETLARSTTLQMIVHAGTGPGDLAIEDASGQGVFVTHCPDMDAVAVAELALALMLALDRQLVPSALALRAGQPEPPALAGARGLAGRTLGLLGFGPAAAALSRRAQAMEMHVLAWSPSLPVGPETVPGVEFCNWPRELARKSDVVVVHAGRPDEREVLVDADFLAALQPGAELVYVGHPGAVDESALVAAIEEGRLRVALDIFAPDTAGEGNRLRRRLLESPAVLGVSRTATHTAQARQATADEVVRVVRAFLVSGEVLNCLNLAERSPATWQLVIRVRDQVGVMAAILDAVRADGINAEEISSRVFVGAKAAWCTIALDERPSTEALAAIRALPDVLHLELRAVV